MSVSLETLAETDDHAEPGPKASGGSPAPVPQPADRLRIARGILTGLGISLCLWFGIAMIVVWLRGSVS